jgi:hypothetical protein
MTSYVAAGTWHRVFPVLVRQSVVVLLAEVSATDCDLHTFNGAIFDGRVNREEPSFWMPACVVKRPALPHCVGMEDLLLVVELHGRDADGLVRVDISANPSEDMAGSRGEERLIRPFPSNALIRAFDRGAAKRSCRLKDHADKVAAAKIMPVGPNRSASYAHDAVRALRRVGGVKRQTQLVAAFRCRR